MTAQISLTPEQYTYLLSGMKYPVLGAGGGFAPIGTESYIDGTTAPQGWLVCDGSTHNIVDYPELATYIASHHGSANYYGGDGVTTFAVPKRSGMPNGGEILSGTEKVIGIDENRKPVYAQFVDFGSGITIPTNSWYGTSINSSSMDRIIYAGASRTGNNSGLYIPLLASTNANTTVELKAATTNSDMRYLYLKYTKTNDTAVPLGHSADGNGVFCVKATVAGDPNAHVYSTEEQVVGTWIDGKTVYEKTLVFNSSTKDLGTYSYINELVDSNGYIINSLDGNRLAFGYNSQNIEFRVNKSMYLSSEYTPSKTVVIIRYTKTTDQ